MLNVCLSGNESSDAEHDSIYFAPLDGYENDVDPDYDVSNANCDSE